MNNIYYAPEKFGLKLIAEIEYAEPGYFDIRAIWQNGEYCYTARDSGVDGQHPFEPFNAIEDLERLNLDDIEREVRNERLSSYSNITKAQAEAFLKKIKGLKN